MSDELRKKMAKKEFKASQQDMYGIFQLNKTEEGKKLLFMSMDSLRKYGERIDYDNYDLVYAAPWSPELSLERIYEIFNTAHPEDFKGHSLSVSDVVVIRNKNITTAYFVDSADFKDVTLEFWQPCQYAVSVADRYISIQECDDGFDYSIYDSEYKLLDGGVYDDPDVTIAEAWAEIFDDMLHDLELRGKAGRLSACVQINYDELEEKVYECLKGTDRRT